MSWTAEGSTDGAIEVPAPTTGRPRGAIAFCHRDYALLAIAVLALAAFNLTFRLGSEIVTEWDESLYAITASEIIQSGDWIGTTFLGSLDYYNTKPPLNVWLVALAFTALGTNLIALRLVSVLSAWLTIAVLMWWSRRLFGPPVALLAGLVLATTFGFLYVHAARSANTDALFALLILLTVVSLWAAQDHPWRRVWLGPLAAAVFLLKGTAVLMPLAIVLAVTVLTRRRQPTRWLPTAAALLLFLVPVLACAVVLALAVAEGKLLWYSFHHRDLTRSVQGLLLAEGDALPGHRVFRNRWNRAEIFVIRGVLRAERGLAVDVEDFMGQSRPGDYLVSSYDLQHPDLAVVQSHGQHQLYRRLDAPPFAQTVAIPPSMNSQDTLSETTV